MTAKLGLKSMANFSKQASVALRSGLTMSRTFSLITRESRDVRLRRTVEELHAEVLSGSTLAESLRFRADRFPPIFVEMVNAGEKSGRLDQVFQQLADYFDRRVKLRGAVIRASIYPAIQLSMLYAVFCLITILFSSDKIEMGMVIAYYTMTALIILTATILFFWRTAVGRRILHRVVVGTPIVRGIAIKLCMTRFMRSLAMQIESAIPMVEALERSALVAGNETVTKSLLQIVEPVRYGSSLAEAVQDSRFTTPLVREVLAIGEETGEFCDSLYRAANIYEEEAAAVLEALPKFITPLVVIIVGIGVVYLFLKVYYFQYLKPLIESVGM